MILVLSLVIGWSPLNKLSTKPFEKPLTSKMTEATIVMGSTIALGFAIDMIPVNSLEQVATKLFDIAGYLMLVLGAIVVMKILLATSLLFSFGIIIPIACMIAIFCLIKENEILLVLAKKLAIFAIVFALAIPAAVGISLAIDSTFEAERARLKEDINAVSSEVQGATKDLESIESSSSSGGILDRASGFFDNVGNNVRMLASNITGKIKGAMQNLMLLVVQWIVTVCVVPIVTLIGFGFVIRILFGVDINPNLA